MLALLFISFLVLLLLGFDVGFSMIVAALVVVVFKTGQAVDPVTIPMSMLAGVDSRPGAGAALHPRGRADEVGGLTLRLIAWSQSLLGHWRGSLGHTSILTNLIMAGVSGSAVADAVATGKPLIPAMVKARYGEGFAGAVIAAGALLGPIIPPSIPMVVYGQLANQSVIKLFMAGVMPASVLAAGFIALCAIISRRRNYAPSIRATWAERGRATWSASWALMMPVIIILGLRFGLVTDTEAAAVATVYALLVGLIVYRSIDLRSLPHILVTTGRSTGAILFLLAAAGPFSWLVAESQVSAALSELIRSIATNPTATLLIINGFLLLIGCIVEPLPAMIIFVPFCFHLSRSWASIPSTSVQLWC